MSLIIEPSDILTFQRPFKDVTKEVLLVTNPNAEPAIFKVKTTAPKQYCVRPNAGRIEGHGQVEVKVILQPFEDEPPLDFKCKDKFLVQSALVHSHEYDSIPITDLWSRIETEDRGSIRQHKIKCSFVSAPVQDTPTPDNNTTSKAESHHSSQALESDRSDSIHGVSASHDTKEYNLSASNSTSDTLRPTTLPEENLATKAATDDLVTAETTKDQPPVVIDTTAPSNLEQQPAAAPHYSQTEAEKEPQTTTPVTAAPATTSILKDGTKPSSPLPVTAEDHPTRSLSHTDPNVLTKQEEPVVALRQEEKKSLVDEDEKRQLRQALDAAQQQITHLQRELEQNKLEAEGLRLRQNASSADSRKLPPNVQPSDAVHQHLAQLQKPHPVEGYPPQVVAIMCGVIFLFTYLFF